MMDDEERIDKAELIEEIELLEDETIEGVKPLTILK